MTTHRSSTRRPGGPSLLAFAGYPLVALAACASSGPFVPDTTDKIPAPSAREGGDANDVFMRAPWELWRTPRGIARYHRETFALLPDESESSFKASEVSVYAADGSDVRVDYASVDLGAGSQSREFVSVFVYRAPEDLDGEWASVTKRLQQKWSGATAAEPFPVPDHHPAETRQMALLVPARTGDKADPTFVQTTLFHRGNWAVRYELTCPAADLRVARGKTLAFLRSLRAQE